jgi:D-2-hydroxyacid dehydrogenase (NADP+)
MTKIHILAPIIAEAYTAALMPLFPDLIFSIGATREDEGKGFHGCDALFTFGEFLRPDSFEKNKKIRWVQALGTGLDGIIDHPGLSDDVTISSLRGIHGPQVSELVFMHMLSLGRDYPRIVKNQTNKVWERWSGQTLQNKTIGLLGVGKISEALAKRCKAFDMEVVGITNSPRKLESFDRMVVRSDLLHIVAELDYLVVLVPLSEETRGLVGKKIFTAMKKSAYFINVSRGDVVDEDALLAALSNGDIAGAGSDVFVQEPLPSNSPLWEQANLMLTPHIGGLVDVYVEQSIPILKHNIEAFLAKQETTMINFFDRRRFSR